MSNQSRVESLKEKVAKLNSVSDTYCLAKWLQSTTTLYNGYTHSCHHPAAHKIQISDIKQNPRGLHNTPIKLAARADMLQGVQTPECDYCWNIENLGQDHFSDRHYKSANPGMGFWPQLDAVVASGVGADIAPSYLEVAFENICNFKCSYCSPDVSSRWMEEVEHYGGFPLPNGEVLHDLDWMRKVGRFPIHHKQDNPYISAFWQWWPELYQSLDTFRITGGEPLLSQNTWKILEYVGANPRPGFKLGINTNMGVPRRLVEQLAAAVTELEGKIGEITIFTSAESVGRAAEYSRFGMDWTAFQENIEYFLEHTPSTVRLQFMTTVNILSVSTYHEFLEYVVQCRQRHGGPSRDRSRIGFSTSYLRWPRHQSITLLDAPQRAAFDQRLRDTYAAWSGDGKLENFYIEEIDQIDRLLNYMHSVEPDPEQLDAFVGFFDEYDHRRGTRLLEVFPELEATYLHGHEIRAKRIETGVPRSC